MFFLIFLSSSATLFLFQEQRSSKSKFEITFVSKILFLVKLNFCLLHSWRGAFHTVLFVSLVACSYGDYWQMNNLGHLTGGWRWASVHVADWWLVPWPYSGQGWIPRHGGCHWEEGQSLIPKLKPHFLNSSQFSVGVCVCVGHAFDCLCWVPTVFNNLGKFGKSELPILRPWRLRICFWFLPRS